MFIKKSEIGWEFLQTPVLPETITLLLMINWLLIYYPHPLQTTQFFAFKETTSVIEYTATQHIT